MKKIFFKYIICSLAIFTIFFANLNVIACSVNSKCLNNSSVNSDCMTNKFATVPQAFERYLASVEHPDYSEYEYEMILVKEVTGSYFYSDTVYYCYKSLEPIYYDSSSSRYILPAKTFRGEILTIEDKGYSGNKDSCIGSSYCVPSWDSSQSWTSSLPGDVFSLNYDLCDTNGNVVSGATLSTGSISITMPPANNKSCVQVGSNDVQMDVCYNYTNFLNKEPTIEISGIYEYEITSNSFDINDKGQAYGLNSYKFTLNYGEQTKITVSFYDDLNNYYEDNITIICYSDNDAVPDGSIVTNDTNTNTGGGSSSNSAGGGSASSDPNSFNGKMSSFFSDVQEMLDGLSGVFTNFVAFIGRSFGFLPPVVNVIIGLSFVICLLLRIFGR